MTRVFAISLQIDFVRTYLIFMENRIQLSLGKQTNASKLFAFDLRINNEHKYFHIIPFCSHRIK